MTSLTARAYPQFLISYWYGEETSPRVVTITAQDAQQARTIFERDWRGLRIDAIAQVIPGV